jgi:hypothetical protein
MDVHVPQSVTDQLRRRVVDVLTAIEDGAERLEDWGGGSRDCYLVISFAARSASMSRIWN